MNKERRNLISDAVDELEAIKAKIEKVSTDEQDAFNNLPESFANGERGEKMQGNVECLEEAVSNIEEAIQQLQVSTD